MRDSTEPVAPTEETAPTVSVIRIPVNERCIVLVKFDRPVPIEVSQRVSEQVSETLYTWWESGKKFLTLVADAGVDVELERSG